MTFTHKLARRLARLRAPVMFASIALAAACSSGGPTGVDESSSLTNTPTQTSQPTSAGQPESSGQPGSSGQPAPSVAYPNQPAAFAPIAENGFDGALPDGGQSCSDFGILHGCWSRYSSQVNVVQDGSAPQSPGSALEYTWPAGLPIGTSAGSVNGWDGSNGGDLSRSEYSQIYESAWFKLEGADFEAPDAGMKLLGFWGVGQAGDGNRVANQVYGMIPGGVRSAFTVDIRQQGPVSRSMTPNRNDAPLIVVGQWTRYEVYMKLNDIGRANGVLKVWINGKLTHDYSDVTWRTPEAPSGFFGRRWDPTWGGMGNPSHKTRTDRMLVDHIYISGAR
ncbi:MAG TPA: hypothetical protein VFS33_04080 [Gemmatimonadales bacterium]|nr:hypothetical protein [Gemmatimonadales bacterium]